MVMGEGVVSGEGGGGGVEGRGRKVVKGGRWRTKTVLLTVIIPHSNITI